jgi:glucose-1-phosphate thymidylyltransferase
MVDVDEQDQVRKIIIKPSQTHLCYTWGIAVWAPVFTEFLHEHLAPLKGLAAAHDELSVGDVLQAAIDKGLRVKGLQVSDEPYLDIGTPEDLPTAVTRCANQ